MIKKIRRDSVLPPAMAYPKLLLRSQLSETEKVIYVMLLDRALNETKTDDEGNIFTVYPITEIAREIGKSEMTVKKSLASLELFELIQRVHQKPGRANRIYVGTEIHEPETNEAQSLGEHNLSNEENIVSPETNKADKHARGHKTVPAYESATYHKPIKTAYGRYANVLLTDEEYACLSRKYKQCDEYIERLSWYMYTKGRGYDDHAGTIEKWINEDYN